MPDQRNITVRELLRRSAAVERVKKTVAEFYGLTVSEMLRDSRLPRIAHPRQVAMHLARKTTDATFQEIQRLFGFKHHGTVMHAVAVVADRSETSPRVRGELQLLREKLAEDVPAE